MGFLENIRNLTLQEVEEEAEFVDYTEDDSAMIFAARTTPRAYASNNDLRELGTTGQSLLTSFAREEYNSELRGLNGLRTYDKMRRGDAQVRATLRLIKTPILAGHWYVEPSSEDEHDREVAKFVWDNLTKWMSIS